MWEAFCAFHICIACTLPELLRRLIAQRAVWAFPVILLSPTRQGASYIVQGSEPAGVEALVAQPAMEALDVAVLHGTAWLGMHQPDPPVLRPSQHAPRGELRPVVRAHAGHARRSAAPAPASPARSRDWCQPPAPGTRACIRPPRSGCAPSARLPDCPR